jgi:hypothetical protein
LRAVRFERRGALKLERPAEVVRDQKAAYVTPVGHFDRRQKTETEQFFAGVDGHATSSPESADGLSPGSAVLRLNSTPVTERLEDSAGRSSPKLHAQKSIPKPFCHLTMRALRSIRRRDGKQLLCVRLALFGKQCD